MVPLNKLCHKAGKISSYINTNTLILNFILQDIVGKRGYLILLSAMLTIPVFVILAFTSLYPLIATLGLGFTYSLAAVSMTLQTFCESHFNIPKKTLANGLQHVSLTEMYFYIMKRFILFLYIIGTFLISTTRKYQVRTMEVCLRAYFCLCFKILTITIKVAFNHGTTKYESSCNLPSQVGNILKV